MPLDVYHTISKHKVQLASLNHAFLCEKQKMPVYHLLHGYDVNHFEEKEILVVVVSLRYEKCHYNIVPVISH